MGVGVPIGSGEILPGAADSSAGGAGSPTKMLDAADLKSSDMGNRSSSSLGGLLLGGCGCILENKKTDLRPGRMVAPQKFSGYSGKRTPSTARFEASVLSVLS